MLRLQQQGHNSVTDHLGKSIKINGTRIEKYKRYLSPSETI